MINKNIHIIAYKELYSILNEIKNDLKFKIYNHKSNKDFFDLINNDTVDFKNSVLLCGKSNKNFIDIANRLKINYFNFENLPIKIDKLVETLNVQLIKKKYDNQSKINIKNYIINLNSRTITNNDKDLKLTEKEVNIILFLNDNKIPITIDTLQNEVWGYSTKLETHTVETHIYRLRKKINDKFKDNKFIISCKNGYSIL